MRIACLNRSRSIGCEYEVTVPLVGNGLGRDVQRVIADVLRANGIRAIARPYCHDPLPLDADIAVEHDSSVHGEDRYAGITWFSVELKTRVFTGLDEWEGIVPKMLDIARYMGARVNHTTGHHVHVGFFEATERRKVIRSLAALIGRIEPLIFGLVAPSRRSNTYCTALGAMPDLGACKTTAELHQCLIGTSRYNGLNLTHVTGVSPRVEYRYHQGTLDPVKARHWLRFLLQVTEHAVQRNCQSFREPLANDRQGFERMATAIGLRVNSKIYRSISPELAETARYLLRRWKHFNGHAHQPVGTTPTQQVIECGVT